MRLRAFCLACLLFAFCTSAFAAAPGAPQPSAQPKQLRIALLLSGGLGDLSYNDAMYEGLIRAARDFGITYQLLIADTPAERPKQLAHAVSGNFDLVISGEYVFQELIAKEAGKHPAVRFASIDKDVNAPNVLSVLFANEEGAFLAGAAAALFAGHEEVPNMGKNPALGWVGGIESPLIEEFKTGFIMGARHINPQITVLTAYVGSFDAPAKGKVAAAGVYAKGARVVMHAAGASGLGVFEAAQEAKGYAVGVDKNQDAVKPGVILTSVLKRVDIAVWYTVETLTRGAFEGGSVLKMNVANAGIGLTDMSTMRRALGDKFPKDLPGKMEVLIQDIKGGKITFTGP